MVIDASFVAYAIFYTGAHCCCSEPTSALGCVWTLIATVIWGTQSLIKLGHWKEDWFAGIKLGQTRMEKAGRCARLCSADLRVLFDLHEHRYPHPFPSLVIWSSSTLIISRFSCCQFVLDAQMLLPWFNNLSFSSSSIPRPHPDTAGDLPDRDADRISEEGPQRQGVPTESSPNPAGREGPQAQHRALQRQPISQVFCN